MADTLSFSDIRAKHAECLRLCNQAAISPGLIADIRKFVEDVRLAGRDIVDDDDREYLRSLLTFWGNWIYNQTRTYPNTNIEPFTAEAAAMHGREAAEKIVKGQPVSEGQRNILIIGGAILLGLIGVIAVVALAVGALPWMFGAITRPPTGTASAAIKLTVEAIHVQNTEIASGMETLSAPTGTPLPTETAAVVATSLSVAPTAGATAAATRAALPPTPTAIAGFTTPTPALTPELPETGGGGFGPPPVAVISVQVISPRSADEIAANQAFEISATYFNLQFGWKLFFVITRLDTAESIILPDSFAVPEDGATGVWTTRALLPTPGLYTINVYIATHSAEIQRLQRWADAGQIVTPETQYDGVILFRDLTIFEVK